MIEISSQGDSYRLCTPRLELRPMRADLHDGLYVARWRNEDSARDAFWTRAVVTPDSHVAFMQHKSPYDLIWLASERARLTIVGMSGLCVDPATFSGEAGRYYIDAAWRGQGLAVELDRAVIWFAFDFLRLESVWLDAWASNAASIATHRKAGWLCMGHDVPGHTRPGGPVMHMRLTRAEWLAASQP